jgi:hypothetical protein
MSRGSVILSARPALVGYVSAKRRSAMKKFLGVTFLMGIIAGAYWSIKTASPDRPRLR